MFAKWAKKVGFNLSLLRKACACLSYVVHDGQVLLPDLLH
jgi:hypothetical protein